MRTATLAAAIAVLSIAASGQIIRHDDWRGQRAVWGRDQAFVTHEFQEGIVQIRAAKLAQQRATSPAIREFARQMVAEHSTTNRQLRSLAASRGFQLTRGLDEEQKGVIERLSALEGAGFDRAYVRIMRTEHTKAVAAFERQSRIAVDPSLKRWVADTLPALREHQQMAMDLPMRGYAHRTWHQPVP